MRPFAYAARDFGVATAVMERPPRFCYNSATCQSGQELEP
jgi:hypothetical protein